MKQCQFCAEEVQDAAVVCKHCGRDLVGKPLAVKIDHNYLMLAIIAAVLFFGLLLLTAYCQPM